MTEKLALYGLSVLSAAAAAIVVWYFWQSLATSMFTALGM